MFYKVLSCDQYQDINESILQWVESLPGLTETKDFWNPQPVVSLLKSCPKFLTFLQQNDIMIKTVSVTYGRDPTCCGPHIDTPPARFKLSWPIKNTQYTWNRWFKPKVDVPVAFVNQWGGIIYRDFEELEEIERKELLFPCIIDAGTIHDVWCDSQATFPRIGLQCQLIKEPESL